MDTDRLTTTPGNSPVDHVPADYAPADAGRWFRLAEGRDADKRLFHWDVVVDGDGPTPATAVDTAGLPTVLFCHGNPECSYAYRKVFAALRDRVRRGSLDPVRVVAVDHIGFGRSDRATYETVPMDHADNLEELVAALDLQDVTLVVHDWGGPIGVGALLRDPERVSALVACNTTIFPFPFVGRTFSDYPIEWLPWASFPTVTPDALWPAVGSYAVFRTPTGPTGLLGGLALYAARTAVGRFPATERDARRVYYEQFGDPWNVAASKRLVRQTRYWAHGNTFEDRRLGERNTAPFYRFIRENVGPLWGTSGEGIEVRLVFGGWDPLAKEPVYDQWRDHMPAAEGHVETLDGVSHFVEEQRPERVARAVADVTGE
jgi:pimeloyl-ACP methyl ester carboxylesterase